MKQLSYILIALLLCAVPGLGQIQDCGHNRSTLQKDACIIAPGIFCNGDTAITRAHQQWDVRIVVDTIIKPVDLQALPARIDSLEVKLARARVVAVLDSIKISTNTVVSGFEIDHGLYVDAVTGETWPDSIWRCFTRYEISFEPEAK